MSTEYPMHPDIQFFWEKAGYQIVDEVDWLNNMNTRIMSKNPNLLLPSLAALQEKLEWGTNWVRLDANGNYVETTALITKDFPEANTYVLDGKTYSEEQMLRIIKMPAFL